MLQPGETVQSQYAASPVIRALAESARIRIAPDADIELFYRSVFNIATASGAGLDIWGRILGMGRKVDIAMANISAADAASLNNLLQGLFPGRNIVVYETGVMALELFLYFPLEPWERTILKNYGLIAKGAGVELNWVEIPYPVFGFNEAGYDPFDSEPFWDGSPR